MKISCLKKYLFGNVISFFGYLVFIFYIHYYLVFRPKDLVLQNEIIEKNGEDLLSGLYEGFFSIVYMVLIVFFLVLLLIEFLIRKRYKIEFFKNISFSDNIVKIYNIIFYTGLFFTAIPIYFFLYYFVIFCVNYFS